MEIRKRVIGDKNPDMLTSMVDLGSTFKSQSCSKEAISLTKTRFKLRNQILDPTNPDTEPTLEVLNSEYEYLEYLD